MKNKKLKNKCYDCGKKIGHHFKKCRVCYERSHKAEQKNCIDCGKKIKNYYAKRCRKCSGKYRQKEKSNCIDCGKQLKYLHAKRCWNCQLKFWKSSRPNCIDCGKSIVRGSKRCYGCNGKFFSGNNHHNWVEYQNCVDCGKQLLTKSKGSKRCYSCSGKFKLTQKKYLKKLSKSMHLKPNKPETFLIKLLNINFPKEYKYVGGFKFFLGGKNPDFMNVNSKKKLIELFGDYWHKDEDPRNRIKHFKKYGFDTLVIWEKELKEKNINRLNKKLIKFHNKKKIVNHGKSINTN